jgi:hypothetical protein
VEDLVFILPEAEHSSSSCVSPLVDFLLSVGIAGIFFCGVPVDRQHFLLGLVGIFDGGSERNEITGLVVGLF